MNATEPFGGRTLVATWAREILSYRINRFLHVHLGLMLVIGVLALLAPPEAAATGAAWWVLNGVNYVASLSALLLGLSSAQAEAEEFDLLFTQPLRVRSWVAGKCAGLAGVAVAASLLLVLPVMFASGASLVLFGTAAAAAGISVVMAWMGLAAGLWIQDPVRGLIQTLVVWCVLLFGVDLVLILLGGAAWVHAHPAPWVGVLMVSPLDAFRVTLLFVIERAAFSGANLHALTRWWLAHPIVWLTICLAGWCVAMFAAAVWAAHRRRIR